MYTLICNIHSITWKNRLRLYSDRQIKATILMSLREKGPRPHLWSLGFKAIYIFFKRYISIYSILSPHLLQLVIFVCLINSICARVHADSLAATRSPIHVQTFDFSVCFFPSQRMISSGLHFGLIEGEIWKFWQSNGYNFVSLARHRIHVRFKDQKIKQNNTKKRKKKKMYCPFAKTDRNKNKTQNGNSLHK